MAIAVGGALMLIPILPFRFSSVSETAQYSVKLTVAPLTNE